MKKLLLLFITLISLSATAQQISWEDFLQQLNDDLTSQQEDAQENSKNNDEWGDFIEELHERHEHPMNLNKVTADDLHQLFFLSKEATEGILRHRDRYGPLRSISELVVVESVSWRERQLLHLFAYVDSIDEERPDRWDFTYAKNEITASADIPLYKRDGWPWARGIANRFRWDFKLPHHLHVGVRAETDAGERMFCKQTHLWDAVGAYASITTKGWLEQLQIGDYKVSFAEGVVISNGFRFGKMMNSQWRRPSGFRVHRSSDEVNFFRGVAASIRMGHHWNIAAFYSYRRLDAVIQADNSVYNLITTGLHRTENELSHKGTVGGHTAGGHLEWHNKGWAAGLTGLFQRYDHQMRPGLSLYQQIAPWGYRFGDVSINYSFKHRPWLFSGETARSFSAGKDGWACLHRLVWKPNTILQLAAIQRFYSQHYFSPYSNSFGENTKNQNESGLCLMTDAQWLRTYALSAYIDIFYSPFPRYLMTKASRGGEGMLQASWQGSKHGISARYQIKSKERNDARYWSHRIKTTWSFNPTDFWSFQALAQLNLYKTVDSNSTGYALMTTSNYTSKTWRWRTMLSYFHTDDYDSRLYFYEPNLTQSFSFPAFYYHGMRLSTTLRWQSASAQWFLESKFSLTHYFDRGEISSGVTRIGSSWKGEVQVVLRVRI